jgi:DNA-binding transcriptional ArsR family regulator
VAAATPLSYCSMSTVHTCSMTVKQMLNVKPPSRDTSGAPDLATIDIVTVLQALSDPVRLEIVRQLAGCAAGELTCGQIELPVSKSTTSHHLKALSAAGIIGEREAGTRKYLHLRREELDRRFPGLIESVLRAPRPPATARATDGDHLR